MSKEILTALVQLFAIFAKQDEGVSKEERDLVSLFLKQTLSKDSAAFYLEEFDRLAGLHKNTHSKRKSLVSDSTKTLRICAQINKELTHVQKVIVTFNLLEMIAVAGKGISEAESDFLTTAVDIFNIDKKEFNSIRDFILSNKIYELDLENLLIIDAHSIHDKVHSKHLYSKELEGVMGILHIESAEIYLVRYLGPLALKLNGISIWSHKSYIFPKGSTIRGSKISSIYFSDIVGEFLKDEEFTKITFIAENVEYRFLNGKIGLHPVDICEQSGKLVGLMGASGSGKSTLLNVLSGIDKPKSGEVRINGINIHKNPKDIEGIIGFIPQDDLLIEELTVYQNLYFAAELSYKNHSEKELKELVLTTLNKLGLSEIKHLKVGSVLEKTISGGQRKRVNIALELLREPAVLFVDEPTSGLSSRDSENIMDLLKELALTGKLVFVVIHQPSSEIFKLFDSLLILDKGGYPIYYGNPIDAIIYFKHQANQINADEGECVYCGNVNPEQIFNIVETHVVDEYGQFTEQRKVNPKDWNELYKKKKRPVILGEETSKVKVLFSVPSFIKQIQIFLKRDILSKLSNKQYLLINLLEAPVLALILGFILRSYNTSNGNKIYLYSKNDNMAAYIFMSIIVALFMGLTVSAEEIIKDKKILKREQFLNLSWLSYLFSKLGLLFTISAIQTLTFVLIGNFLLDVKDMYFSYWLMLFSISCFANILGLNISNSFKSVITIYILIPLLLIPQIILSGIVVDFDKLNPSLNSSKSVPIIGDIMVSRWAYEALAVHQVKNNNYTKLIYIYDRELAQIDYKKVYYLPHLEKDLDECVQHLDTKNDIFIHKLNIIAHELKKLENEIQGASFEELNKLNSTDFDILIASKLKQHLAKINTYYVRKYNSIYKQKEEYLSSLNQDLKKLQNQYNNKYLYDITRNINTENRIYEDEGELVQKIYPIYQTPEYTHFLDYRTQFYLPEKHLFGTIFDTFWFNLSVIWAFTIALFLMLYYKSLYKVVSIFEKSN